MVKLVNKLIKKQEEAKPAPKPTNEELLLKEIRDILKENRG
jgi:large conductance mechanosensitive channel